MLVSLPVCGAQGCLARVSRLAWAYVPMCLWAYGAIGHNGTQTNEV